jgi:predicted transposase YdaD
MFITVQSEKCSVNYHIEFQTQNDKAMAIRMFRHGFEKAQLINIEFKKLIKVIESVGKSSTELYEKEEINASDFERILLVLKNMSDYIYKKYGEYRQMEKEVEAMLTSLYNPAIAKENRKIGKEIGKKEKALEIAKEALKEGADVDFIVKITKLDKETVLKIKEELQN